MNGPYAKEALVITALRKYSHSHLSPLKIFKEHGGVFTAATGKPDLEFIWNGVTMYMEVKRQDGKLTTNQIATINEMRSCKARVWVAKPNTKMEFYFRSPIPGGKIIELAADISTKECWTDLFLGPDNEDVLRRVTYVSALD